MRWPVSYTHLDVYKRQDLCIAGGIVNAYQAILEAEKVGK